MEKKFGECIVCGKSVGQNFVSRISNGETTILHEQCLIDSRFIDKTNAALSILSERLSKLLLAYYKGELDAGDFYEEAMDIMFDCLVNDEDKGDFKFGGASESKSIGSLGELLNYINSKIQQ